VTERCCGIGYEGRTLPELLAALTAAGVTRLVDVRERPSSRKPGFSKASLDRELGARGIEYVHCRAAGNPFRHAEGSWTELYREHLAAHPEILDALEALVRGRRAALLCFEAERAECHRGQLLAGLAARNPGLEVVDLR